MRAREDNSSKNSSNGNSQQQQQQTKGTRHLQHHHAPFIKNINFREAREGAHSKSQQLALQNESDQQMEQCSKHDL